MSELQKIIDNAYEAAKAGHWDRLLKDWEESPVLANRCSRFVKSGSMWTFLHQAAYFGNKRACRELIARGASVDALTHDGLLPSDVATSKNHSALAEFLRNASMGRESLWHPPSDPDVLPSSDRWNEATQAIAASLMFVSYAGGLVKIPTRSQYFTDSLGRVLVGWHGTYDPPRDMDGRSCLD